MKAAAIPEAPPAQEDQTNEFKAAEALKDPALIAREVVAFLNAGGGYIWIGVEENANGITFQQIQEPRKAVDSLHNHLVDTIEPAVQSGDIQIDIIDGDRIRVVVDDVRPRGPYAHLVKRGRWFGVRVGARVREMTYDEIAGAFERQRAERTTAPARDLRLEAIGRTQAEQANVSARLRGLWLRVEPTRPMAIDFDEDGTKDTFRKWLTQQLPGDVPNAWSHHVARGLGELTFPEGQRCLHRLTDFKKLEITAGGVVTFVVAERKLVRDHFGKGTELSPYAVMGFPTSVLRLVSKVFRTFGDGTDSEFVVAMMIGGVAGASLYPGSPRDPFYEEEEGVEARSDTLDRATPFVFKSKEVVDEPDRCALRLVRWIYEGCFGLDISDIPPEFDRDRGILSLS